MKVYKITFKSFTGDCLETVGVHYTKDENYVNLIKSIDPDLEYNEIEELGEEDE